jgi:hypothetical protein
MGQDTQDGSVGMSLVDQYGDMVLLSYVMYGWLLHHNALCSQNWLSPTAAKPIFGWSFSVD